MQRAGLCRPRADRNDEVRMSILNISPSRRDALALGIALAAGGTCPVVAQGPRTKLAVNIVNTTGNAALTLQHLIRKQGYFEELGLEPTMVNVSDGSKLMGALISGGSDICAIAGFSQVLPAIEKGARMKLIAASGQLAVQTIYTTRPDIRTVKDLEGRTVGVGSLGALLHQMMVAVLRKKGVDPAKVTFANIGSSADVFRAVVAGTVDAGPGQVDVYDQQEKYKVRALTDGDLWVELPEYTYQGSFTSQRAIDTRRDVLVRTLAAYLKLYRFISGPDSEEAFVKARLAALGARDPKAAIAEGEFQWRFIQKNQPYTKDLILSEERVAYMQDLNIRTGIQKSTLPYTRVADMSLAREAQKLAG
jgi:ABC-type nitrate/sulfonate/bicarbonate transport system substrate-binding protein